MGTRTHSLLASNKVYVMFGTASSKFLCAHVFSREVRMRETLKERCRERCPAWPLIPRTDG